MCEIARVRLRMKYFFLFLCLSLPSSSSAERQFYRISFVVDDRGATLTLADVERAAALWVRWCSQRCTSQWLYSGDLCKFNLWCPTESSKKGKSFSVWWNFQNRNSFTAHKKHGLKSSWKCVMGPSWPPSGYIIIFLNTNLFAPKVDKVQIQP